MHEYRSALLYSRRLSIKSQPAAAPRRALVRAGICFLLGLLSLIAIPPALHVLTHYRSQDHVKIDPVQQAGRPRLVERVILVVISGIGLDDLGARDDPWRLLNLRRRAAEGAFGSARAVAPSGDLPTWAALLTGAGPAVSGVVDEAPAGPRSAVPSLFDQAHRSGLRSVVIANAHSWHARSRVAMPDRVVTSPSSRQVGDTASAVLAERKEQLAVILLDVGRLAALQRTVRLGELDRQIGLIAGQVDPKRDLLIIAGDHGLLPDGTSGGDEPPVAKVPLVLWGSLVIREGFGAVDQRDIAPTVSALLGLDYERTTEGRPLLCLLHVTVSRRAEELVRLLDAQLVGVAPNMDAGTALQTREAAHAAGARGDWEGAGRAAEQGLALVAASRAPAARWSASWIWGGGLPAALLVLGWLAARFRWVLRRLLLPLAGLELYLIAWSLLFFVLAGKRLSLSALYGDWQQHLAEAGRWSALALGAMAVAFGFGRARSGLLTVASDTAGAALLIVAALLLGAGIALALAWPWNGGLPALDGWAVLLLLLTQAAAVGLAAPLAALLAILLSEVVARGR